MQADLQILAAHAKVGLSPFVREVIIADLLGRGSLPERPEMIGEATFQAQRWERGEDVEMLEMKHFDGPGHVEKVWREDAEVHS